MAMTDSATGMLLDGSSPVQSDELLTRLASLGIEHRTMEHPPVFTVDEAKALRGEIVGAHTKNLFLRNKKGRMWLVTCLEDREIDLKTLAEAVGARNFSFASHERLTRYLGVIPGAVTPFALVNDVGGAVQFVLDNAVKSRGPLNLHPLDNARTTSISVTDLVHFLNHINHPVVWLDFDSMSLVG